MNLPAPQFTTSPATAQWATRIIARWQESFVGILDAGRLLSEAKAALPHGEFGGMIRSELPFTVSTAQRLMIIASDERLANPAHVQLLPPHWGTLYELTKLDDEQFAACVADKTVRPDMERKDVRDTIALRNATSRRILARDLSDKTASLSATGRKFAVLYADPAWRRKAGIGNRAYENHYTTMTWEELLAMSVKDRLLPDAWGFVWIPRAHLLAAIEVETDTSLGRAKVKLPLAWAIAQAWGFDSYSTCFVWTKTDEETPDDHGLGLIAWDQDELLLLFKRGRGLPKPDTEKKYGSNHRARAGKHSAKPAFYRDMINDMTGGVQVLELFAREDDDNVLPPNFFTWGNQSRNTAGLPEHDPETGEIVERPNRKNALTPDELEASPEIVLSVVSPRVASPLTSAGDGHG